MSQLMDDTERELVGKAYEKIAERFDVTRIQVWQGVRNFLTDIPTGSLVGDIGCGNGKNMLFRKEELKFRGCDTCQEFIKMGKDKGLDIREGNILNIPFPDNTFNATICIAVIHHLSSLERRTQAIAELARVTEPGGKILIQVWATKQPEKSRRTFTPGDNLVPWINNITMEKTNRYYYVFEEKELDKLCLSVPGVEIIESFYEFGNWALVLQVKDEKKVVL